jgi:hypothetical protein
MTLEANIKKLQEVSTQAKTVTPPVKNTKPTKGPKKQTK